MDYQPQDSAILVSSVNMLLRDTGSIPVRFFLWGWYMCGNEKIPGYFAQVSGDFRNG